MSSSNCCFLICIQISQEFRALKAALARSHNGSDVSRLEVEDKASRASAILGWPPGRETEGVGLRIVAL